MMGAPGVILCPWISIQRNSSCAIAPSTLAPGTTPRYRQYVCRSSSVLSFPEDKPSSSIVGLTKRESQPLSQGVYREELYTFASKLMHWSNVNSYAPKYTTRQTNMITKSVLNVPRTKCWLTSLAEHGTDRTAPPTLGCIQRQFCGWSSWSYWESVSRNVLMLFGVDTSYLLLTKVDMLPSG